MTRSLLWSAAIAAALAFTSPLEAAPKKKKGGGGKRPAAMAMKKHKPKAMAHRGGGGQRAKSFARGRNFQNRQIVRSPQRKSPAIAKQRSIQRSINRSQAKQRAVAQQRSIARSQRNIARHQSATAQRLAQQRRAQQRWAQQQRANAAARQRASIAFGGSRRNVYSPRIVNRETNYDVKNYYTPPYTVYRDWDRGRHHWWNNRQYGWRNNTWVVLDLPSVSFSTSGSVDSLATSVQAALDREGYDPGPIDGVIGSQTREAIADYQSDHGLAVTGEINESLLSSLGL